METPENCPKCGAQPVLRKTCSTCGNGEWVITHDAHYKWGNEVVPCGCRGEGKLARAKKAAERAAVDARQAKRSAPMGAHRKGDPSPITPEMAKACAYGMARGLTPGQAMREAGFPESTIKRGRRGLNAMVMAELRTVGRKYIELGRRLTPEDQEALVRGRLAENTICGSDKGVLSAKQLGADKRISMWQPDSVQGMIILGQAPEVRQMKHEVPWLEPEHHDEDLPE